ncbi:MAG: hypothetical protein JWM34_1718 [Ilumatobacteraceae bacterium]|nr:hypothetical protein [Ilumatobacteraceae bacterium]
MMQGWTRTGRALGVVCLLALVASCGADLPDAPAAPSTTQVTVDTNPIVTAPAMTEPPVTSPDATSPDTTSPDTTSPDATSPVITSPSTTSPSSTSSVVVPVTSAVSIVPVSSATSGANGLPTSLTGGGRSSPSRVVLIGDSITAELCPLFPASPCVAFPGAWVADRNGANLVDQFVTEADLQPTDTVILSSIGGWHSFGVNDAVILTRLNALFDRISHLVRRVILLVPPTPNFQLCTNPDTPEAKALLGLRHDEVCATQQAIADLERTWPVTQVPITGPYMPDLEHETPAGRYELAQAIEKALGTT